MWTKEQQQAIDCRDSNIIVSAAAGSGKTSILVERVIKKITDNVNPVDIDKLLIVTFTNAAAAEMKTRISKKLSEALNKHQNNTNIKKQISLLPNANISTTDSFCINLVRENFFKLDIQQDFDIVDDAQDSIIKNDAINAVLDEYYDSDDEDFKRVLSFLSDPNDEKPFIEAIKKINNYIMVLPFPFEWLDDVAQSYNPSVDINDSKWFDFVKKHIKSNLDTVINMTKACLDLIEENDDLYDVLIEIFESDLSQLKAIEKANSWDSYKASIEALKFKNFTKKNSEFSCRDIVYNNRSLYRDIFSKEIKPIISISEEEYIEDCKILYPIVLTLVDIVKKYNKKTLEIKKEMNAYTFNDIEHFAIELLSEVTEDKKVVKSALAEEYCSHFEEVLIDEYQDTNKAHDFIYEMLSRKDNRFMVGDVKQSIYRFRLAMPQIFTNKKDSFDPYGTANSIKQKIILDKNFRSRKGICDYVNHVFSTVMTKEIGELDYNQEEYLNNGAEYNETDMPSAQIKLVKAPEDVDLEEYEAQQIAKLIQSKIDAKEQVKCGDNEYRDIQYGDFAILLRAASTSMPIYHKTLTQCGIPVVSNSKTKLFDTNEVSILLSFLRAIDNPSLDIPLLATLMSVFYGYTPDEIANAKINHRAKNLYGSISQDECFTKFINDIDVYKKYSSSMSVEAFIRQIINDTSYLSIVSSMGNADTRKSNVMQFVELAKSFDKGENVGLTAFIRYIDAVSKSNSKFDSASSVSSNVNAVQITTIHSSKGLEYPVCILANSRHRYNKSDNGDKIQLNLDYGLGLKVYDEERFYRYNSVQYDCIKELNDVSSQSEALRVLYVALTRAKEQFITFFTHKNIDKFIDSLSKKIFQGSIPPTTVKHVLSDGEIILMCALLHPDSNELRELCSAEIKPNLALDYKLDVDIIDEFNEIEESNVVAVNPSSELVDKIMDRLSFSYERAELSQFSSKRAASSLDNKEKGFKYLASSKPSFLNDSGLTPAEKGTALHAFMEHCDFSNAKADLTAEIERLVNNAYLSKEQANVLNKSKLSKFFDSELAKRILVSNNVNREIKVSSFVSACELEDTEFDDKILVQGIADLVFEENGELVLVDYKTDNVESEEELLDLYKHQISFYKNAIQKTLNKPVKEALLYSFSLNKECIYK